MRAPEAAPLLDDMLIDLVGGSGALAPGPPQACDPTIETLQLPLEQLIPDANNDVVLNSDVDLQIVLDGGAGLLGAAPALPGDIASGQDVSGYIVYEMSNDIRIFADREIDFI